MPRPAYVLPFLCLPLLASLAQAATDPRVTSTVLAENFYLDDGLTKGKPGQLGIDPKRIFVAPDGTKVALVTTNADKSVSVVLGGRPGPGFNSIKSPQWSTAGRTFLFVGEKGGKQVILRNNVAADPVNEGGVYVNGLRGIDGLVSTKLFFGLSNDAGITDTSKQTWTLRGAVKPAEMNRFDNLYPNADGSSVFMRGTLSNGTDALWRDDKFYGPLTKFGLNPPMDPVWSPDGKHATFALDNEKKHFFMVDTQSIFNLDGEVRVAWSPTSDRLIVYGQSLMTVVFKVSPEGKTSVDYNAKFPLAGKPYWTRNGQHYSFYLPRTGQLIVDGRTKTENLHYNSGDAPPLLDRDFYETLRAPHSAVSEDGVHWAATDVRKGETGIETFVRWDGKEGAAHDGIFDLRWSPTGAGPVYLARDVKAGVALKDADWTFVDGTDAISLASGADDEKCRPLGPVSLPDANTARIVMLETDKVVRYDVKLER